MTSAVPRPTPPPPTSAPITPPVGGHAAEPLTVASVALVMLTVVLWGGTPVAISYSVDTLPPIAVAGIRFFLASAFMLAWCRIEGASLRMKPGQLGPCCITGTLLFVQISLFHLGIAESNSSHATLFINTFIFWVALLEHFVTRVSRLSGRKLAGLALAATGVVLILRDPSAGTATATAAAHPEQPSLYGDILLLGSGMVLGIKIIYTKSAVRVVEPGKLIFWHDVVGTLLFAVYAAAFEHVTVDLQDPGLPAAVWGLLYQGLVVAGFCFAVQARLLRKHAASQISVFSFATPLFGIALAVWLRGDPLSPWLSLSAVCVAAGIVLVNREARG